MGHPHARWAAQVDRVQPFDRQGAVRSADPARRAKRQVRKSRRRRASCENGISLLDTVLAKTNSYVNKYLLEMLGAPKYVGETKTWLEKLADDLDEILGPVLNPLRWAADKIKEYLADYVKDK